MRAINILGQKFNQLTVLKRVKPDKFGHVQWLCSCDCGRTARSICSGDNLIRGRSKSCKLCKLEKIGNANRGKSKKPRIPIDWSLRRKATFEAVLNLLFGNYKRHAARALRVFELDKSVFSDLIKGSCYYCGIVGGRVMKTGRLKNHEWRVNGIDRLDNGVGYTEKNCVSCCSLCNRMKHAFDKNVFMAQIFKIAEYQRSVDANNQLFNEHY